MSTTSPRRRTPKKKDNRRHILWRYFLITVMIMCFAVAISVKLFSTTVLHADRWNKKAMEELARTDTIKPERGEILAADGNVLATNLRYYTLRIDYRSERFKRERLLLSVDSLADSLAKYYPHRSKDEWKAYFLQPMEGKAPNKWPRAKLILRDISYAEMMHVRSFPYLNMRNRNRSGLTVESRLRRRNPYGDMARRSIGSISEDPATGEFHGISGLEMALDTLLYGVPGRAKKIPLTHNIVNWTDVEPTPGYNIVTTIDINMQDIVENELNALLEEKNADWGVAVLMEVKTGDIKAISNLEKSPTTGKYIEGMNRAVLGFEPGSVVKTLSMLVALEDGIVTNLNEAIPTGGSWAYAGGKPITDSHYTSALKVSEVLEHSSNIGMARIITREYGDKPDDYYKRIEKLGFFDPMNTGIAGERIPNFPKPPSKLTLSRVSYGYATEIPPLSTLAVYNAIANDGRYVRPRLVKRLIGQDVDSVLPVTYIRDSICSRKNAAILRDMLSQVVWGDHGTGRRLRNPLVSIAGKTGTSYMVDSGRYNTSRKRLTFCGFFPADNPQYSCIVLTCRPREGAVGAAATSGTVLKNIALKMYSRGMLGNSSDYHENPATGSGPTIFACQGDQRVGNLKNALSFGAFSYFATPRTVPNGTVPSVMGLGLRDAVNCLERAGFNVRIHGDGYVLSQSPEAGANVPKSTTINLSLTHL